MSDTEIQDTAVTDDATENATDATTATTDDDFDGIIADLEADRDTWKQRASDADKIVEALRERAEAAEKKQADAEAALAAAQTAADAGEADQADASGTPEKASQTDAGEPEPDAAVEGQRQNAEAAKWRKRLREAQVQHEAAIAALTAERDGLADTLARTRQAQVDARLAEAGLDMRVLTAGGHTLDTLVGDDGLIDNGRLDAAVADSLVAFQRPRKPSPNPLMGRGGADPAVRKNGKDIWDAAFRT
jgi:hypothetical protein